MIVYTGKQFWNDFNNWDEGLFQDANRPRDDNKFKIRPWLQSDKWKQRDTNKDIYTRAASLIGESTKSAGAAWSLPDDFTVATLTDKYKNWDPWCILRDWNLVIQRSWTYILQAFCQFIIDSLSSWYYYSHYVALLRYRDSKWNIMNMTQWRFCGTWDQLMTWQIWWFNEWDVFNVWAAHNFNDSVTMYEVLNAYRLG